MKKKSVLALTLGISLAVGSLALGTYTLGEANQRPMGTECKQFQHDRPMVDGQKHQEMLKLLQIDEQTFKQEKESGKTLAEIAAGHNISRQAILDMVVKHMNEGIEKGLADGRLSQEQATQMKIHAVEKAEKMIDGKDRGFHKMQGPNKDGNGKPMYDREKHQEILSLLQIDEQTFKQEKSSGKSLAEIAANHNVSRQAVLDVVVKHMNERIEQGLAEQKLTTEQGNEMKAHVLEKAQEMVDNKMMGHHGKHQR